MSGASFGFAEELGLERAAIAELELERALALRRRDHLRAFAVRAELAETRDRVVALELLEERS